MAVSERVIKSIMDFYFKNELNGYLGNARRIDVPNMPGYRQIGFEDRRKKLRFLECYTKYLGSHQSSGWVTIWLNEIPAWTMNYSGGYQRPALRILKEALRRTFVAKHFLGGRGPVHFTLPTDRGQLVYTNNVSGDSTFTRFETRESVKEEWWDGGTPCGLFLGSQHISGKLLLD